MARGRLLWHGDGVDTPVRRHANESRYRKHALNSPLTRALWRLSEALLNPTVGFVYSPINRDDEGPNLLTTLLESGTQPICNACVYLYLFNTINMNKCPSIERDEVMPFTGKFNLVSEKGKKELGIITTLQNVLPKKKNRIFINV